MASHEHAVEYSAGLGGPSPMGARPFAMTVHMDALAWLPLLEYPLAVPAMELMVAFAPYLGGAVDGLGGIPVLRDPLTVPVEELMVEPALYLGDAAAMAHYHQYKTLCETHDSPTNC